MNEARSRPGDPALETRWETIRAKLEANAEWLGAQGVMVPKRANGRRFWAIRFLAREGGRRVHKSIYIASDDQPDLLRRARALLDKFREQGRWPGQIAAYARLAASISGIMRRKPSRRSSAGRRSGR